MTFVITLAIWAVPLCGGGLDGCVRGGQDTCDIRGGHGGLTLLVTLMMTLVVALLVTCWHYIAASRAQLLTTQNPTKDQRCLQQVAYLNSQ